MFDVGDAVVHPRCGAGVVTQIKTLEFLGNEEKPYYSIQLLGEPKTTVMVPVRDEKKVGLRSPVPESRLGHIWRVLRSNPNKLPADHDERYEMLKDKLRDARAAEVAEVLRDLAWRREQRNHLTLRGERLYERGMRLLAGEVAGAQGTDFSVAESAISDVLLGSMAPSTTALPSRMEAHSHVEEGGNGCEPAHRALGTLGKSGRNTSRTK